MLIKFLVQTLQSTEYFFAHENIKQDIFIIALAVQTAQKAKSHTTKSHVLQDWVFRLGCHLFLPAKALSPCQIVFDVSDVC